jgi:hypothetical protein
MSTSVGYFESNVTAQVLLLANSNELIPITDVTTNDFTIQNGNQLVCANPGSWLFTVQYQLFGLENLEKSNNYIITGWVLFGANGNTPTAITNSVIPISNTKKDADSLTNTFVIKNMNVGDIIRIGIRTDIINESKQSTDSICKSYDTSNSVFTLSLNISGIIFQ